MLAGYLGSALNRIGRQIVLNVGGSAGVVSSTISGNETFDASSAMISAIDGGLSSRNVTALASCEIVGMMKAFYNAGATNNLVIRSSTPSTLATLAPGDWVILFHNGSAWIKLSVAASVLGSANVWTGLQTFGAGAALKDSVSYFYDDGDATKKVAIQASGITTGTTRTLTAPDASGTLSLVDLAQTFSALQTFGAGAVLKDSVSYFYDDGDATKRVAIQCSGVTTGNTRVLTPPDANATLAATDVVQTYSVIPVFGAGATVQGALTTTDGVSAGTVRKVGGLAYNAVASGTLGPTGGTAETALQTYTVPANTIKQGTRLRITATVMATAETGTTTLTLRVRLGGVSGTLLVTTPAFDLGSTDMVSVDATAIGRAAPGAAASVATQGTIAGKMAGTTSTYIVVNAPANYATNGALDVVLTGQFSASDANAVASTIFSVVVEG